LLKPRTIIILMIVVAMLFTIINFVTNDPWGKLYSYLVIDEQPMATDAIIVLGGAPGRDVYAAELYNSGFSSKIIISDIQPYVRQMANRALKQGVKQEDIILEDRALNTYQNALFSKEIMIENGYQSAIIVSSSYHMRRVKLVFERVYKHTGISLTYCPVPPNLSNDIEKSPASFRQFVAVEYVKLIYYWFRYW
jgi:uncharacterized SAM-binding protein YcdF (DUF218 family)